MQNPGAQQGESSNAQGSEKNGGRLRSQHPVRRDPAAPQRWLVPLHSLPALPPAGSAQCGSGSVLRSHCGDVLYVCDAPPEVGGQPAASLLPRAARLLLVLSLAVGPSAAPSRRHICCRGVSAARGCLCLGAGLWRARPWNFAGPQRRALASASASGD